MMPAPLLNRDDHAHHIFGYVIGLVLTGTSEAGLLSGENGFKVVYLQVVKGGLWQAACICFVGSNPTTTTEESV